MIIRRPKIGGDMYQIARVSPSNFFRMLSGPGGQMVILRNEFVVALDSLGGEYAQNLSFSTLPAAGTFQLSYLGNPTTDLAFNITAADLQIAIRLVAGLSQILVTGDAASGFVFTFRGFSTVPALMVPQNFGTLEDATPVAVTPSVVATNVLWDSAPHLLLIGDKIHHPEQGQQAIYETELLSDLGGAPMGMRVRTQ